MATPEELLRKLDERFILGEIADEQYQQMRKRLQAQVDAASEVRISTDSSDAPGDAPAHAGGMNIADSVIKGNVTSGSASVGNININVGGQSAGGSSAELEYEKCVMLTLRSGGSLESIRKELDDRRMAIGLPIRLAREIEEACLASCGRRPIQGRTLTGPTAPSGPDPLTRFFKSASNSIASMFSSPPSTPQQPRPSMTRLTPVPPVPPQFRPTGAGVPPPVPWLAPPPPKADASKSAAPPMPDGDPRLHDEKAASTKEAIKEELRAGLKAELARSAAESGAVDAGDGPVKSEAPAPIMRKPPPLPPLPPPLQMPNSAKEGA